MPRIKRDGKKTRLCYECIASLCPRAPEPAYIWLQGDPVCRAIKFNQRSEWIKVQQRIDKLPCPVDGFFTVEMLKQILKVKIGMKGKCPAHYRSRKYSPEQRDLIDRMKQGGDEERDKVLKAGSVRRRSTRATDN